MFLHIFRFIYILPSFFQGLAISGAMKYAVEQINNCSSLLPGVQLDFLFNDTKVELAIGYSLKPQTKAPSLKIFLRATSGAATLS